MDFRYFLVKNIFLQQCRIGTRDAFTITAQLNTKQMDAGLGSVRRSKEFIVHPDEIKQALRVGEVFYLTKVEGFRKNKIKMHSKS